MSDTSGNPSLSELGRRLTRVEDLVDDRIATVDMVRSVEKNCLDRLIASEKLQEARELTVAATSQAQGSRIGKLESSNSKLTFMLIAAFLTLLISIITQVLTASGRA